MLDTITSSRQDRYEVKDESMGIMRPWNWVYRLEQREEENRERIRANEERRDLDAKTGIGVLGGLLALTLLTLTRG